MDNRLQTFKEQIIGCNCVDWEALYNTGDQVPCIGDNGVWINNTNSKLTTAKVLEMRRLISDGEVTNYTTLSKMFGVGYGTAKDAVTGKSWSHLPGACDVNLYVYTPPTSVQLIEMRARWKNREAVPVMIKELAEDYGFSTTQISRIVHNKAHIA